MRGVQECVAIDASSILPTTSSSWSKCVCYLHCAVPTCVALMSPAESISPGDTFEPAPLVDETYPATTDYYWGTVNKNMSLRPAGSSFATGNGPLGFDTSIELDGSGCMVHDNWVHRGDSCASNPADCEHGLSFSLWTIVELEGEELLFAEEDQGQLRYLLSTGGDMNGSPGVAIYLQGHVLTAVVSTGAHYWRVQLRGHLVNNTWTNIGVLWRKTADDKGSKGLELYINAELMAMTMLPESASGAAASPINPVEIMVGCHRTAAYSDYRHKCHCTFDEVAMWTRPLHSHNETVFFLGGFDARDADMTPESLLERFRQCARCTQDPLLFKSVVQKMMALANTAPSASPTVSSTAAAGFVEEEEVSDAQLPEGTPIANKEEVALVKGLAQIVKAITANVKEDMGKGELPIFVDAMVGLLDRMLEPDNLPSWRSLESVEKEDGGSAELVGGTEDWMLNCADSVNIRNKDQVIVSEVRANTEVELTKMKSFNIRQNPTPKFPSNTQRVLNTIQIASEIFDVPGCTFEDANVLFVNYDTYSKVSPKRFSSIGLSSDDADLLNVDGSVLTLKVKMNESCMPSEEKLRQYPVLSCIGHHDYSPALRKPQFHEDEIQTDLLRRSCVWWNPGLSDYGGWDATGCKATEYTDFYTKCVCSHLGQYSIMIEKVPPKVVDLEFMWLKVIKYVCYALSAILLIIFIAAVIGFRQLHEMFHLMRLNTAFGILIGSIFMCLTDIQSIREDRHLCVGLGAVVHFFYLMAGTMVMLEGIADFMSVTNGAIGGKLKSYVAFSWGVPFLSLGYAMLFYLQEYGTDPRCMVGWKDEVKWTLFLPMVVCLCFAFLMACIVSCNMQASRLRKENIVAEQLTVCKGFVFFAIYFAVTWAVGVIAYMRLGLKVPSFYPLFQVLNSTGGIMFFLFCGVGSERFRLLIAGQAKLRKKMLFSYTVSEQLSESQQKLHEKQPSRPATPEEEQVYDPNARGPRGPLVA